MSGSGVRFPRSTLALWLACAATAVYAQTGQTPVQNPHSEQAPVFSAAGAQGTTAPAGYSSGLSREQSSAVLSGRVSLQEEILSGLLAGEPAQSCASEPGLLRAEKTNPSAFEPNHALGLLYLRHGEPARSIGYLRSAAEARPSAAGNTGALALALLAAGRNAEALQVLQTATRAAQPDAKILRLLALAWQRSGERLQSLQAWQSALAAAPDDVDNEFGCGVGLLMDGAPERADAVFASATAGHPRDAKLWTGRGLVQLLKNQDIEAIESFLQAVRLNPGYVPPYSFLANLAEAAPEHRAEVRDRLAEFVVSDPESAEAHYDYAVALWKQHRSDPTVASTSAIESQLRMALALNPSMAAAHLRLGELSAERLDRVSAEKELLETVKLDPQNAEAHYRLAQAYRQDQQPERAKEEMRRFLALHGTAASLQDSAQAHIQEMGSELLQAIRSAARCDAPSAQRR